MIEVHGVTWSTRKVGRNAIHTMAFDGRVLSGCWCGPRAIFRVLAAMTPEQRQGLPLDYDSCMGDLARLIEKR